MKKRARPARAAAAALSSPRPPRRATSKRHDDHRRRQLVRLAARLDLDACARLGVRLHGQYSPVGSGAGIAAITNRQVDFGASDAPLTPDQSTACKGCVQIPWALAGDRRSPYNVPGAPVHLNLDGDVIAKIFLGQITNWNDPAIKALNKGASMPDLKITPVFRSDGSGTTYNFTDYLSAVSPALEVEGRQLDQPVNFPTGIGAQRLGRRRRRRLAHAGRASPTSTSRSRSRTTSSSRRSGTRPASSSSRASAASRRPRRAFTKVPAEQRAAHRQPAEVGAARVPDLRPTPT